MGLELSMVRNVWQGKRYSSNVPYKYSRGNIKPDHGLICVTMMQLKIREPSCSERLSYHMFSNGL
jgi:hypothetical protein